MRVYFVETGWRVGDERDTWESENTAKSRSKSVYLYNIIMVNYGQLQSCPHQSPNH